MKELSFAQNFAMIALNALDSLHLTNAKKVALRCVAAATILELYLDNEETDDSMTIHKNQSSLYFYHETVLNALIGDNEKLHETLAHILKKVTKLSNKKLKDIESAFRDTLKHYAVLEEIPALLGCDLEYVTASISMKEYRSNSEVYTRLIEGLRAEILEDGFMTDETIFTLWLLRESGCLYDIFSKEELKRVAVRMNDLLTSHDLAKRVMPITIHKTVETTIYNFLKIKKEAMSTPTGTGFTFIFPFIERSESVFIDTESYFANKDDRLLAVINRLEQNGHTYQIIREGDVPLIKIDNVIYEAVPHAKQYRVPVHGVRLRRHPLSL